MSEVAATKISTLTPGMSASLPISHVPTESTLNRHPRLSNPNALPRRRLRNARGPRGCGQGHAGTDRELATSGPPDCVFARSPMVELDNRRILGEVSDVEFVAQKRVIEQKYDY